MDVMYLPCRTDYGYLSDEALEEAAALLGMTPLELEELATFYDFIYREPVGRYVIHVCDGVVCWMHGIPVGSGLSSPETGHRFRARPRRTAYSPCCPPAASATATGPRP